MSAQAIRFHLTATIAIANGVLLEVLRRKDLYVVAFLMGLFLISVIVMRLIGIDDPATGTFLLNLGLSLSGISAHLLTMLLALRQLPDEIEHRTLYPLLARPIPRSCVITGKWLACTLAGIAVYAALFVLTSLCVPRMETYNAGLLLQHALLQPVSLAWLAGMSIAASLFLTRGFALVLCGGLYIGGSFLAGFLGSFTSGIPGAFSLLTPWIPQYGRLNLITRYTDGIGTLSLTDWLTLTIYGALWCVAFLWIATLRFNTRRL